MIIGIFQFEPKFGDRAYNLEKIEHVLMNTDADLVVLPELCTTGYQFVSMTEVRSLCECIPDGESIRRFKTICQKRKMHLVAGLGEKYGDNCYNSSVLIGPDGIIGVYRKIHLFDEEKLWFLPGSESFRIWDIGLAKIGMMICFDWIFPESVRSLALAGADVICHPANLVLPFCPDAMITRSIENRVFTITSNRIGEESRGGKTSLHFIGCSQATDPSGRRLLQFTPDEEGVKTVEIDVSLARDKKVTQRNDLWEDRHVKLYRG